jgi:tetratricopeptide (TPR) repeat protein
MSLLVQSLYDKESYRLPQRQEICDLCANRVKSFLNTVIEQANSNYDGELRRGLTYMHLTRIAAATRNSSQCRAYFDLANASFQRLTENYPKDPIPIIELAQCHYIRGLHHWAHGELTIAKMRFRPAADAFRAANELEPQHKRAACLRAYFLVTCPDPEMRAPDEALQLVSPWMSAEPSDNSTLVNIIASCAMYRIDDWNKALKFARHTGGETEAAEICELIIAMAHWKLGEEEHARSILRGFVRKRESGHWSYEDDDALWAEASALLEVPELGPPIR